MTLDPASSARQTPLETASNRVATQPPKSGKEIQKQPTALQPAFSPVGQGHTATQASGPGVGTSTSRFAPASSSGMSNLTRSDAPEGMARKPIEENASAAPANNNISVGNMSCQSGLLSPQPPQTPKQQVGPSKQPLTPSTAQRKTLVPQLLDQLRAELSDSDDEVVAQQPPPKRPRLDSQPSTPSIQVQTSVAAKEPPKGLFSVTTPSRTIQPQIQLPNLPNTPVNSQPTPSTSSSSRPPSQPQQISNQRVPPVVDSATRDAIAKSKAGASSLKRPNGATSHSRNDHQGSEPSASRMNGTQSTIPSTLNLPSGVEPANPPGWLASLKNMISLHRGNDGSSNVTGTPVTTQANREPTTPKSNTASSSKGKEAGTANPVEAGSSTSQNPRPSSSTTAVEAQSPQRRLQMEISIVPMHLRSPKKGEYCINELIDVADARPRKRSGRR